MINVLKLAWKNIVHNRLSSLLSILLFMLGATLITLLLLLNKQLTEKFENNLAGIDLVIGAKGSPLQMILCNMYHVDAPTGNIRLKDSRAFMNPKHPLIKEGVPLSLGDNYKGFRIVGTVPGFIDLYKGKIGVGQLWKESFDVVVGENVARILQLKLGDTFKSSHGLVEDVNMEHDHGKPFKVVGILETTNSVLDQLILCPSESVWEVHEHEEYEHEDEEDHDHDHDEGSTHDHDKGATHEHDHEEHGHDHEHEHDEHGHEEHDHDHEETTLAQTGWELAQRYPDKDITSILVRYKGRNFQTLNLQRNINQNTDVQAASPAIEINRLYGLMGIGMDTMRWLALAIIIVSAISVFFSLLNSLKDRKYELALVRVLGGSRGFLFAMILLEGIYLALLGSILGIILGHIIMWRLSGSLTQQYKYQFEPWQFLQQEWYIVFAAIGIGILAALWPALRAYGTQISATLRNR